MHVLQPNFPLSSHPHVRDNRARLDRIGADQIRHGAERARERVAEISEAFPFEEGHSPPVDVMAGPASAFPETSKREAEIRRGVCLRCIGRWGGGVQSTLTFTGCSCQSYCCFTAVITAKCFASRSRLLLSRQVVDDGNAKTSARDCCLELYNERQKKATTSYYIVLQVEHSFRR